MTEDLGNAVLADRAAVMDAVQDQRQRAYSYGYLRSGSQYRVVAPRVEERGRRSPQNDSNGGLKSAAD